MIGFVHWLFQVTLFSTSHQATKRNERVTWALRQTPTGSDLGISVYADLACRSDRQPLDTARSASCCGDGDTGLGRHSSKLGVVSWHESSKGKVSQEPEWNSPKVTPDGWNHILSRTWRKSEHRIARLLLIFYCSELIMVEEVLEMGVRTSLKNYKASPNSRVLFLISDSVNYGSLSPVNSSLNPSWRCSCRGSFNPPRLLQRAPGRLR